MMHRVSVITPVWNMARFLPDAIASVPDVHEILIVAAPSDDDTHDVARGLAARRPNIRVLDNPKRAPAYARNIGLQASSGDVIAFVDADDVWPQNRLAMLLARLDAEPHVDAVSGLMTFFTELDRERLVPADRSHLKTLFAPSVVTSIFRRSVFDRIGTFDESLLYGEDGDFLLRMIEAEVPFVILDTATLYCRRHGDSMMTRDDPRKKSDMARTFALSLARRRRLGLPSKPVSFDRYREAASP